MKFDFKGYFAPTPKLIRKFADALLGASVFLGTSSVALDHSKIGIAVVIIGTFAKFLSNFFVDETSNTTA